MYNIYIYIYTHIHIHIHITYVYNVYDVYNHVSYVSSLNGGGSEGAPQVAPRPPYLLPYSTPL